MGKFFLPKATTAERTGLTPDDGTILYDETEQMLYFGDGSTAGGNTLQGDVGPEGPPGTLTAVVDDTSPQLGGFLDTNGNFIGMDQGGNLASASPLVIGTDGDYFDVTGTTGFAIMTVAAKRFFILQFDGALVVTHGASIVIPGGANFTTSPGDQFQCFSIAANTVRIVAITRADGTPVAINLVDDTSPQLGSFLDPNDNYVGSDKGGNLASASPLVLGIDGDYFDITGTTGFSTITVAANRRFRLQFNGVLAITVGAGITLNNGGSNFTTAIGDIIDFQSVAANVVVGTITKADGTIILTPGTTGNVLTSTGSVWESASLPIGGDTWNLIGTVEASASASLTITGLDSTYDTYAIAISDLISANDDVQMQMRFGDSGGIKTDANYFNHTKTSHSGLTSYLANIGSSNTVILISGSIGNATGEGYGARFDLHRPADGNMHPSITGETVWVRQDNGETAGGSMVARYNSALVLDRVFIKCATGNITSGRMTIWGISHA